MTLRVRPEIDGLHVVQEWEGYVLEIVGDEFVARLVDLTAGSSHEEEEATIPLTAISDGDAGELQIGRTFRWVIGYEHAPSGNRKCVSRIVFRDLPRVTDRDLRQAQSWARETMQVFKA